MPQNLVNSKQQTVNSRQGTKKKRQRTEDRGQRRVEISFDCRASECLERKVGAYCNTPNSFVVAGSNPARKLRFGLYRRHNAGSPLVPCLCILILVLILFINCAPSKLIRNDLVWPQPPEKPRIKFVEILSNDKDLLTTRWDKFKDFLFGWLARNYLDNPYACAAYRTTRVYVSDPGSNAVFVFDRERKDVWLIGTEKEGGLWMPVGLDVDENGNLYVVDTKQAKVFVYDSNGKFLRSFGEGKLTNPVGLTFANHRVYVTDSKAHVIKVFDPAGNLEKEIGRRGSGDGEFNFPLYITHDKEGNIYVVDTMNFRFQIFDREGNFIKAIGSPGDVSGTFARPKGIAVDSEGHIYVSDAAFNNVQIFDKEGNFLLNFGSYGRAPGELLFPAGMCFDEIDRLYIAEQMNSRVQVFQYVKVQP